MSVRELRGITPTFQQVMNKQLGKVMDAIDQGDMLQAFISLRTLILALNPEDKQPLKTNEVAHLQKNMTDIQGLNSVDLHQTRQLRENHFNKITPDILDLYEKVMEVLHSKGYLEIQKIIPTGKYGT